MESAAKTAIDIISDNWGVLATGAGTLGSWFATKEYYSKKRKTELRLEEARADMQEAETRSVEAKSRDEEIALLYNRLERFQELMKQQDELYDVVLEDNTRLITKNQELVTELTRVKAEKKECAEEVVKLKEQIEKGRS